MKTLTWIVCGFLLTTFHPNANAKTIETRIVKIEPSSAPSAPALIFLEDGRLLRIDPANKTGLRTFQRLAQRGDTIRFSADRIGRYHRVSDLEVMPATVETGWMNDLAPRSNINADYVPTDFVTADAVNAEFKKLTWNMRKRSQCYQRAENWVYEMYTRNQTLSMKIFVFYTRKYINEYDFDWWFHVAPYVVASGAEFVMDRTFTNTPRSVQDWTWEFVPKNINCVLITKYTDYENHQTEQYCYHIKVPMYYYQPKDVAAMEKDTFVTDFIPWELAHARRAY